MSQSARQFRDYEAAEGPVRALYRENHERQTLWFVRSREEEYLSLCK